MPGDQSKDLFPHLCNPQGTQFINERCVLRTQDNFRVVLVSGIPLTQYAVGDRMSEAHAMVSLVDQGWANQNEVAKAFGCTTRTVRRHQRRFEEGGLSALGRVSGYPEGRARLVPTRKELIEQLKSQGHSTYEIARRLGTSARAVRKSLRRFGWKATPAAQPELPLRGTPATPLRPPASATASTAPLGSGEDPNLSAFSMGPIAQPSSDNDPSNRWGDRLLARLGLLGDAPPLFGTGHATPRAGVLLAVPVLIRSSIFDCAHKIYGSLGPAFFGLRTTLLTLLLMALWRIRRPEGLKEHSPAELGRVLGVDRAPEVKTLRRKLARLAAAGRAAEFGRALAQQRVARRGEVLGFLYVDGHVRVYHGKHWLPKAHVARMRLCMPATSDYWVNDSSGDPLFVVTAEANASLVRTLPGLLRELRPLLGSRRATVVFDRGGYSPTLFQQMVAAGFDFITYRKGRFRSLPARCFQPRRLRAHGRTITYLLADQEVRLLKGKLRLRQVTRRMEDGHQTRILTSRRDLPPAQVAYRMFDRWRQENFFKYLRDEFALDALAQYAVQPDDPTRQVPNPVWLKLDAQLRQAHAHWERLQAEYGLEAFANSEKQRRTMRGFRIAQAPLQRKIIQAWQRILQLQARRGKVPHHVPVQSLGPEPVVKLAPEMKHLTNLVKMVAYQAESDLVRLVTPHYRRVAHEGRTLLQSALASAADLNVTDQELRITLLPQSSPHRTRAIGALCEQLNVLQTCFPGTQLRLRYAIHT